MRWSSFRLLGALLSAAALVGTQSSTKSLSLTFLPPSTTSSPSSSTAASPAATDKTPPAVPSAPADLQAVIPSGPVPPSQPLCTSPIYCPGPLLQAVQLSGIFSDSKTFVDKATSKPEADVVAAFKQLGDGHGGNITYKEIIQFVEDNFAAEGLELVPAELGSEFKPEPAFLSKVQDDIVRQWAKQIHSYWKDLARTTNASSPTGEQCKGCVSSFIPFKERRNFVVPGGRFRELYYWDSFFVIQGLIKSELPSVVKAMLENFGDLIERFGFVPNGNRVYYENRSQPPFLTMMVDDYIKAYNDTLILKRFLPLLEREMEFWRNNRTIEFTSPYTQKTHNITRYAVNNSAPRPESYKVDYETVQMANKSGLDLNATAKALLYSNLASGAESGIDYSAARWSKRPTINLTDNVPAQRFLNTQAQLPVDLNSILFAAEQRLSSFYHMSVNGSQPNATRASYWKKQAEARKQAILDVFWDPSRKLFYDFNTTAGDRAMSYTAAGFFPLWAEILPSEFVNETLTMDQRRQSMQGVFAGLRYLIDRYNGTYPASVIQTGQQWDFPNAWPPHTYIAIQALRNVPHLLAQGSRLAAPNGTFSLIPNRSYGNNTIIVNQLGQTEDHLPIEPIEHLPGKTLPLTNTTAIGATDPQDPFKDIHPLINVGNSTHASSESWRDELVRQLSNRYIASALCSWRATGGHLNTTDSALQPVSEQILKTNSFANTTGNMFEKFNTTNLNEAGGGGEYASQKGFGWTNGVALWIAGELGDQLTKPDCPTVVARNLTNN